MVEIPLWLLILLCIFAGFTSILLVSAVLVILFELIDSLAKIIINKSKAKRDAAYSERIMSEIKAKDAKEETKESDNDETLIA